MVVTYRVLRVGKCPRRGPIGKLGEIAGLDQDEKFAIIGRHSLAMHISEYRGQVT